MAVTTATIALWCNGNTADFGSVIRGSSPRGATNFLSTLLNGREI